MKRFPIIGTLLLVPAMALTVLVGCSKDEGKKTGTDGNKPAADGGKGGDGATTDITTATTGKFVGTVKLKGTAPTMKPIPKLPEHSDKEICLKGDVKDQLWMVNNDGLVENVVVSLEPPAGKAFKITDELKKAFEKSRGKFVTMDQPFCQYEPHVAAMFVGVQDFKVLNSAKITHNVKIVAAEKNGGPTLENLSPKADYVRKPSLKMQKEPINVECNAHTWMNAKLLTFDHPYFAVTKKDGSFVIENVPIDEEFTVNIWHESKGKNVEAAKQKFKDGETKLDLTVAP